MKKYFKVRHNSNLELAISWLFIISILAFVAYKIFYIGLPYFWDESWVYGPALSEMSTRFPSLLPGSIDIDLSRGHPMLFHFLGGSWGNIFGNSISSLHAFALSISAILTFTTWKYTKELSSSVYAKLAVLILLSQAIFLAQSAMVLPEVMVSLFAIISIYKWSKEKYIQGVIFASLCLLTKESGAILMPALGLSWLISSIMQENFSWKKAFYILLLLILACAPYILFLVLQKIRFGWMLYPNHIDLQVSQPWVFQRQLKYSLYYLLFKDGRIVLSCFSLISLLWFYRKSRLFWSSVLYTCINILFIFVWDWSQWITVSLYLGFMFISLAAMIILFKEHYKKEHYFILISLIFLILFLLFTAFNFYSSRYILVCIILYLILSTSSFKLWKKLSIPFILSLLISICCLFFALKDYEASDVNQSYINYGRAQLALITYMEENQLYEEAIFAPFLVKEGLEKRHAGFRSNDTIFTNIKYGFDDQKVMYNILSSRSEEKVSQRNLDDRKLLNSERFEFGNAWFVLEKYGEK